MHRWLGLSLGAVLFVSSTMGGLLVAQREFAEFAERSLTIVAPRAQRVPLAAIVSAVQARAPEGLRLRSLIFDPDPAHAVRAQLTSMPIHPRYVSRLENRQMYASVDPYTGRILAFREENSVPDRWVRTMHVTLFAGRAGVIATTLASFALVLQGLGGVWIYRGAINALRRNPFRYRLGLRIALGDAHRWLGVAGLALSLSWGATGAFMMVYSLPSLLAPAGRPKPFSMPTWNANRSPALEPMVSTARNNFPTAELAEIDLPLASGEPVVVSLLQRDAAIWAKFPGAEFDSATGALLRIIRPADNGFLDKVQASIKPLHFGYYGARWLKWTYFACAWIPAILFVSGFSIWCLRRRN